MHRLISSKWLQYALLIASSIGWANTAYGQSAPELPSFFNQKERLPQPSLQNVTRLRFTTTPDFPPFSTLDSTGGLSGYNIDLAQAICQQLNLDAICQIEALPWSELEERLKNGETDALIAGVAPNAENRQDLAFSRPYLRLPARFVSTKQIKFLPTAAKEIQDMTTGVIKNTAHEQLLKTYFPFLKSTSYSDRNAMLSDLQNGKISAAFDDGMSLAHWFDNEAGSACCHFVGGPYLAPQFLGNGLSITVAKNNPSLADSFNSALQALERKGTLRELYLRYFPTSFY